MIDQIEKYIERGIICIPVVHNQKRAAIPWKEAVLDENAWANQREWFKGRKKVNVAIVTGRVSGLFAIDLDPDKMVTNVEDFKSEFLAENPTDFITKTPRGGYHLWYKIPPNVSLRNTVSFLAPGVDTRGDGGYALAPPSQVWYDELNEARSYSLISFGEAGTLSEEVLNRLTERSVRPDLPEADAEDGELARILEGTFSPGKHNDELFWAARQLARRGLPESTIMDILLRANETDTSPQGTDEAARTIDNGMVSGYSSKNPDPELIMPGTFAGLADLKKTVATTVETTLEVLAQTETGIPQQASDMAFDLMNYADFSVDFQAEEDYLIEDWLPLGSVTLMVAQAGGGKTWLLMDMAITAQLGKTIMKGDGFLGEYKSKYYDPKNVLFIQQEDQPGKITMRMDAIYNVHADRLEGDTRLRPRFENGYFIDDSLKHRAGSHIYLMPHHTLRFDSEKENPFNRLFHTIMEYDIDLVIMDPLYTLGPGDNYFSEFAEYFQSLKNIREEVMHRRGRTVTMTIAHHMSKEGAKNKEGRHALFGSALLDAASDGVTMIWSGEKEDGHLVMEVKASGKAFMRDIDKEVRLDICTDNLHWRFEAIETENGGSVDLNPKEELAYQYFLAHGEATVADIMGQGEWANKRAVERAVSKLKSIGLIANVGKQNRHTLYRLVDENDSNISLF